VEQGSSCYDELWLDVIEMSDLAYVGREWVQVVFFVGSNDLEIIKKGGG